MPTDLKRTLLFGMLSATALTPVAAVAQADCTEAKAHFEIARELNTAPAYEAHIAAFGACPYAAFAEILAEELTGAEAQGGEAAVVPEESAGEPAGQDQAQVLADGLVERFNSLTPQVPEGTPNGEGGPALAYDSAQMEGSDLVVEGLRLLDPEGQGFFFGRAMFTAPRIEPDGTFRADSLALGQGRMYMPMTSQAESEEVIGDVLTLESAEIGGLALPAPGSAGLAGVLPASTAQINGIAIHDQDGQILSLRSVRAELINPVAESAGGDVGDKQSAALIIEGLEFTAERLARSMGDSVDLATMQTMGFEEFDVSFSLGGARDPATGAASGFLTFGVLDAGDISLNIEFAETDLSLLPPLSAGFLSAIAAAPVKLTEASVAYVDASLVERVLGVLAINSGVNDALLRGTLPVLAEPKLVEFGLEADTARAVAKGLRAFLEAPQSVELVLQAEEAIAPAEISSLFQTPNPLAALSETVQASLSFNGTTGIEIAAVGAADSPSAASVQAGSDPAASDPAALAAACDVLAADSDDPVKPAEVAGVKVPEDVDWAAAIPACEAAYAAMPQEPRLGFQLGRAYYAADRFEDAARLYREAADTGHSVAQYELALALFAGRGVEADEAEANRLLEQSSAAGNGYAAYELAVSKVLGSGMEIDTAGAEALFRQAAEFGVSSALTELGKMHFRGDLGEVDYAAAYDYFQQAAAAGEGGGHFYVGFMKTFGWDGGTPEDAASDMMMGLLIGDADAEAFLVEEQGTAFEAEIRVAIQEFLRAESFYTGKADGVLGADVQAAIAAWRAAKGA